MTPTRLPELPQGSGLLFYNSELSPSTCRRFWQWPFEGDPRNVFLTPDRFADVNGAEIVEAKIEPVRQLLSFKSELDAKAETRKIVN